MAIIYFALWTPFIPFILNQQKARESRIRRFSFFPVGPDGTSQATLAQSSLESILQPVKIGPNGFQLRDTTRPTDSYNASQDLFSYYGKLEFSLFERLGIAGGLRWENNDRCQQPEELYLCVVLF